MGESDQPSSSTLRPAGLWLLLGAIFVGILAGTALAFIGGFIGVLYAIDWLAVTALSPYGGRDFWLVNVLTIASFPLYLFVGYTLFTRGYPVVREKAGMVAAYQDSNVGGGLL